MIFGFTFAIKSSNNMIYPRNDITERRYWRTRGIFLVNNQLDALFSVSLFPFSTCFEQLSAHHQENRTL